MNYNRWMMTSLLGGVLLLVTGCLKELSKEMGGTPGCRIEFAASTSYNNDDVTRTEYSGIVLGTSNQIERIDWVPNTDRFTVNYAHGSITDGADFLVTSVEVDGYNSTAGVAEADRTAILSWAEGSDHRFYGMYPAHEVNGYAVLNANHFSATLLPSQPQTHTQSIKAADETGPGWMRMLPDMNYAYMVAYAGPDYGISGNRVILPFRPAVTTFEFRLRRQTGDEGPAVRKFQLISAGHALTGAFSFDITGGDARGAVWGTVTVPEKTEENRVITVDFGASGVALPTVESNSYLDFTVFALPVDLADLSIKLFYSDGTARLMPLKDKNAAGEFTDYHQFRGAKKYVFTNSHVPGDEWEYELDPIDDITFYGHGTVSQAFAVRSVKTKGSTISDVDWTVQYSSDGISWSSALPSGASVTTGSAPAAGYSSVNGNKTTRTISNHTAGMQAIHLNTSEEAPYDLSMHTIYGANRSKTETANSYVVRAPGWYMFPLVYGNGIKNGIANTRAYAPSRPAGVPANNYLTPFLNYRNAGISSPYILTDLGNPGDLNGIIVWQDVVSGLEIIRQSSVSVIDAPANAGLNCKYIRFQIAYDDIKPGNIVIALRSGTTILWSWHIWATDENLATKTVTYKTNYTSFYNGSSATTQMMPVNLGWTDVDNYNATVYTDRVYYVKVIQNESGLETTFAVRQIGDTETVNGERYGSSTQYQWGRKDPFLPGKGGANENKDWVSAGGYVVTTAPNMINREELSRTGGADASLSIKNPHIWYYTQANMISALNDSNAENVYLDGEIGNVEALYNLWNAESSDDNMRLGTAFKTVYDPCPPGFRVPLLNEFNGFVNKGMEHFDDIGSIPLYTYDVTSFNGDYSGNNFQLYCNGVNNSAGTISFPEDRVRLWGQFLSFQPALRISITSLRGKTKETPYDSADKHTGAPDFDSKPWGTDNPPRGMYFFALDDPTSPSAFGGITHGQRMNLDAGATIRPVAE